MLWNANINNKKKEKNKNHFHDGNIQYNTHTKEALFTNEIVRT